MLSQAAREPPNDCGVSESHNQSREEPPSTIASKGEKDDLRNKPDPNKQTSPKRNTKKSTFGDLQQTISKDEALNMKTGSVLGKITLLQQRTQRRPHINIAKSQKEEEEIERKCLR